MSSLELQGKLLTLYLEGSVMIHPSTKGDMTLERNCHVGQGSIYYQGTKEILTLFTFRTDRPTGLTPHGLAQLPDFTELRNGYTWEMVHEELKHGWPPLLIEAYCADLLSQVRNWRQKEKEKGKPLHHILIPHLVLSRLSMAVLEAGFSDKTAPLVMGK